MLPGGSIKSDEMDFEIIDIHQAKDILDKNSVTLVDIRDPESYAESHIKDAISLSDKNFPEFLANTDKTNPLICYCYHGFSSQNAAQFLKHNGFETVYSLKGGFEAWKAAYPTV
jgi:thiosulfate sulfurtransferase